MIDIDKPHKLGLREWLRTIPFVSVHLACLGAIWTGVPIECVLLAVALYVIRMFGVTAGYHRYFSHRAFKLNRFWAFWLGFLAQTSAQRGILWWAGHHRHHHKHSDTPEDAHSPMHHGIVWAHIGWIFSPYWEHANYDNIKDFAKHRELRWLDKSEITPAFFLALACYLWLGWPGLIVGFCWSTVALWHGTFSINSLAHLIGNRRYKTTDDSRNHLGLALITLGEGWHNNHHHYQASVNQGFFWWEIDITYGILVMGSWLGIVRDLKKPPAHVIENRPNPAWVKQTDPTDATSSDSAPVTPIAAAKHAASAAATAAKSVAAKVADHLEDDEFEGAPVPVVAASTPVGGSSE